MITEQELQVLEKIVDDATPLGGISIPLKNRDFYAASHSAILILIAEIRGLRKKQCATCRWIVEPYGERWDTECGLTWTFSDGTPEENDLRFCPGCGKKAEFVPLPERSQEEE